MKRDDGERDGTALERKIAKASKYGIPIATVVGMLVAGKFQGPPLAVLVLAAGALIGVITALWASLRALLGETQLSGADAYAIAAPRAEEEQKRAVLRALKDLEFERSVGKISDEDYQELVTHYRGEAKRLLRLLDDEAQPRRAQVEALVTRRLRDEGLIDGAPTEDEASPAEDESEGDEAERRAKKKKKKKKKARLEAEAASATDEAPEVDAPVRTCASCGTTNDQDAVFCKKCGAKQENS